MAEGKKSSQGSRYGKPPRIGKKPEGDTDKSAHMEKASDEAKSTATEDNKASAGPEDPGPKAEVTAGTDGIPTHARHINEMKETYKRMSQEMSDMHERHQTEIKAMQKRHHGEMEAGGKGEGEAADKAESTAGDPKDYPRKDVGKTGTEPK